MAAEGHLLLILHEPPKPDELQRRGRYFWRAPDGTWQSNNLGAGITALKKHLAEYRDALEKLDRDEQRADLADEYFQLLRDIAPLHRAAHNLYNTLQQAREMVREDADLIVCRDQAYQIHRESELLRSDIHSGLDCAVARRAEEQAKSGEKMALGSHRLNVLAAIFFPVVTISSIMGMNLARGLNEEMLSQWLFWVVLGAGVLCGLLLKAVVIDAPARPARVDRKKQDRPAGSRRPRRS
jgi:Mg2+ and Co2+ transporter CorA